MGCTVSMSVYDVAVPVCCTAMFVVMIEVVVRDGRAGRDRTQDSAEGGVVLATLQRDQPFEIGDVIALADGEPVVIIGSKEAILPAQGWKQTVFIDELKRPKSRLNLNLGSCSEWTLQNAGTATTTFVRCVSADEAGQISESVSFCRKYGTTPTHRLLGSSFRVWQQTYERIASMKRGEWQPGVAEDLLGAFVGWLLIWRLVLDQAEHDLSSRFGKGSDQLARFRLAKRNAYNASTAYRVVEALRNHVQHREMPSLTLKRNETLDHATRLPKMIISYCFPVSALLDSPKCPATIKKEFRDTPDLEFNLPDIVDQAMTAIKPVLIELIEISIPELIIHITRLRVLFSEASGTPLLLRAEPAVDHKPGSIEFKFVELHDLQFLIQNFPMSGITPVWDIHLTGLGQLRGLPWEGPIWAS